MPYFGLIIARPHWFTGSVSDIYLEAHDINHAYESFKEKIADANICWKNDGAYGQAGDPLDLEAYARAAPTRNRDSWEMKDYIDFYTANPRDCALYIDEVKKIPSVDVLANLLYHTLCLGEARYIRPEVIQADIKAKLVDFINSPKFNEVKTSATPDVRQAAEDAGESIWYDTIQDLKWEIQDILMVVRSEFINANRGLDRRIGEMDLELQSILLSYFDTLC